MIRGPTDEQRTKWSKSALHFVLPRAPTRKLPDKLLTSVRLNVSMNCSPLPRKCAAAAFVCEPASGARVIRASGSCQAEPALSPPNVSRTLRSGLGIMERNSEQKVETELFRKIWVATEVG